MRRLLPLALLLCLGLAAPAQAKEVVAATVCGENGCATSHDRDLIAALAEGGHPVDPPRAAAPFFRVRLAIGDEQGKVMERFWTRFVPTGELIRGSDGTWMSATEAYTGALKQVVDPGIAAYPAARLANLLAGDQPVQADRAQGPSGGEPPRSQPGTDGGGIAAMTIALIGGGAVAATVLVLLAVRHRRRTVARPSPARAAKRGQQAA